MSCCANRGYNSATCDTSSLQATDPIVISFRNPNAVTYQSTCTLKDLTQNAGIQEWRGNTQTGRLILTGGGSFPYIGCPSCPLISVTLRLIEGLLGEDEGEVVATWRGSVNLLSGRVVGSLNRTQGYIQPYSFQTQGVYNIECGGTDGDEEEGRTLVMKTLSLIPGQF